MNEEKELGLAKEWLMKQKKESNDLKTHFKELLHEKKQLNKLILTIPPYQLIQRINQNERSLKCVKEQLDMIKNNRQILHDLSTKGKKRQWEETKGDNDDEDDEEDDDAKEDQELMMMSSGGGVLDKKKLAKAKQMKKKRKAAAKQKRNSMNNNNSHNHHAKSSSSLMKPQDQLSIMEKERGQHILSKYYCNYCQSPLRTRGSECKVVCHNCGVNRDFIDVSCPPNFVVNNNNSNNDRGVESNTYERHTHEFDLIDAFREQSNVNVEEIGLDVYLSLQKLIRQHRFGVCKNVTVAKSGTYLRHLHLKHLYKAKQRIANLFNNMTYPIMYEEEEACIVLPFLSLQAPYETIKNTMNDMLEYDSGKERSSFLAYSFTSFHLARAKELHHFTVYFKLLKVERCALSQNRLLAMIFYSLHDPYIVHLR